MGILVILVEIGTLGATVLERVVPHCSRCPHGPVERR